MSVMEHWSAFAGLWVLVAGVGCTDSGTLRIDGRVAPAAEVGSMQQGLTLADGSLVISSARIAVSEIELEGGTEEEEREAEMGAAVIALNVDGTPTSFAVTDVEAGTYHTLGLEFTTRTFDGELASIVVDGTFEGEAFRFTSTWTPEAEFPLDPLVDVPADGEATASVTFDIASWFTSSDGTVIDPTASTSQAAVQGRVIDSISAAAEIEMSDDD